ncbi:MAG: helix-turn-helix domain-containing protein [Paracoccaceae bacterium]
MGSYRHLTRDDRDQIAGMRAAGLTLGEIGSVVSKSKSTISRELRRNALDGGGYSAGVADGSYVARRQRSATLEQDAKLGLFVRQRLSEGSLSGHRVRDALPGNGSSPANIRVVAIRC